MPVSVLIVDDDPVQRRLLGAALSRLGYAALAAENGEAGLELMEGPQGDGIGAVVLDLAMPGLDGIGVLERMREREIRLPVIVQTAQGGIETAVSAMRAGAFDFVVKPASPERFEAALADALKVGAAETAVRRQDRRARPRGFRDIVTASPAMERVMRLSEKAAASTIPILIEGESGVGKELIARAIQGGGPRRGKPFVTVNCGAIPETLVESILFGHEKGAFTGATERRMGKFVEADGGTLFLDEIGELAPDLQVKLLRAVQEGEVDPVGGKGTVKVDIRLISATNRDLLQRVKDGKFREDLYYRLNVFPIMVPPLRERPQDIPHLVRHFLQRNSPARKGGVAYFASERAMRLLCAYDWPGNIRQLENAILRACVLGEGPELTEGEFPQILAQLEGRLDLPGEEEPGSPSAAAVPVAVERPQPPGLPGKALAALDPAGHVRSLAEVEMEMIRLAIAHYQGQMSEVARRLGIGRSTLYRKLKEHGIDPEGR